MPPSFAIAPRAYRAINEPRYLGLGRLIQNRLHLRLRSRADELQML